MSDTAIDNKKLETSMDVSKVAAQADACKKTTGEKYYKWLKFGAAEAFILAATAVIAYVARYGDYAWKGIPNIFKYIQDGFEWLLKPLTKIGKKGGKLNEIGTVVAGAGASTMVTFHGGNAFAPFMKWFDNSKTRIVGFFNRKFGKDGEEEIAQRKLETESRQSWGDVIKGRFAAWAIVFVSFVSGGILAGKDKQTGMYRFDKFEEGFGRKLAGFTKGGKEIAKLSVSEVPKLPEHMASNITYRFGKILALDIYATTAAIAIWNIISAFSAKKRGKKETEKPGAMPSVPDSPAMEATAPDTQYYSSRIKPRAKAVPAKPEDSYAEMVSNQKSNEAVASPSV